MAVKFYFDDPHRLPRNCVLPLRRTAAASGFQEKQEFGVGGLGEDKQGASGGFALRFPVPVHRRAHPSQRCLVSLDIDNRREAIRHSAHLNQAAGG